MTVLLIFIIVAVAYVAAMVFLGRYLRARGHGPKLDALGSRHQKMKEGLRSTLRSLARRPHKRLRDQSDINSQ